LQSHNTNAISPAKTQRMTHLGKFNRTA